MYKVTIPGQPVGKGRPKFVRATGRAYTPKGTAEWERSAALIIRNSFNDAPIDDMTTVTVTAIFARPKRLLRKKDPEGRVPCDVKPDIDNVIKCALDALVMGGALRDDKKVFRVVGSKFFAGKSEGPSVEIIVEK
jgi:Holliday junction resolvase RusA-like endonuclease